MTRSDHAPKLGVAKSLRIVDVPSTTSSSFSALSNVDVSQVDKQLLLVEGCANPTPTALSIVLTASAQLIVHELERVC
jgi:hypothetical protein